MIKNEKTVPCFIYKYGVIKHRKQLGFLKEVILDNRIWFSNPAELNDPFEFRPLIDLGKKGSEKEEFRKWIIDGLRKKDLNWSKARKEASKTMRKLNADPNILRKLFADLIRSKSVYCLTEDPKNILMWAYYGDGHKGYCLKFDTLQSDYFKNHLFRINYSINYPKIKPWSRDFDETGKLSICTKSLEWEHECEWRLFGKHHGHNDLPPNVLVGIIIGYKMESDQKDMIENWCSNRESPVSVSYSSVDDKEYLIHIVDERPET